MDKILQIAVSLTAEGKVNVQAAGPAAGNKVMLLGLLEMAKAALTNPQQEPPSPLLVAKAALPNGGR